MSEIRVIINLPASAVMLGAPGPAPALPFQSVDQLLLQFGSRMAAEFGHLRQDNPVAELWQVDVNNGDGTCDLKLPGGLTKSRVHVINRDVARYLLKGMWVVVRFYRSDPTRPYIQGIGHRLGGDLATGAWTNTRANSSLNFVAPTTGPMIDLTRTTHVNLFPFTFTFLPGLLNFTTSGKPAFVLRGYRDFIQAFDSNGKDVWETDATLYNPGHLGFFSVATACWYCEKLDLLVYAERSEKNGIGVWTSTRLTVFEGSYYSDDGYTVADRLLGAVCDEGMAVVADKIICSYHTHNYPLPVATNTRVVFTLGSTSSFFLESYSGDGSQDSIPVMQRSILCLQLPACELVWAWDPNVLWGSPVPRFARILKPTALFFGNSCNPTDPGNHDSFNSPSHDHDSMSSLNTGYLLPGNPALYLSSQKAIVLPFSGSVGISGEQYIWTNPALAVDQRVRSKAAGQPDEGGPFPAASIGDISTGGVGKGYPYNSVSPDVRGLPYSGGNSNALRGWLVALALGDSSPSKLAIPPIASGTVSIDATGAVTGQELWRYALPELLATDPANYIIDSDSFTKISALQLSQQFPYGFFGIADSGTPGEEVVDVVPGVHVSHHSIVTSAASTAIVTPGQFALKQLQIPSMIGSIPGVPTGNAIQTYAPVGDFFRDYLHWPIGAAYLWEPNTIANGSEASWGKLTQYKPRATGAALAADSDDNVYGAYLRPFLVVSCAKTSGSLARDASTDPHFPAGYFQDYDSSYNLVPDRIDSYYVPDINDAGDDVGQPNATYYGDPWIYIRWRSFVASWSSSGQLRWQRETTTWHDETIDNSPSLAGKLSCPGVTLRQIPTSAGLFVLRAVRVNKKTGVREALLYPGGGSSLRQVPQEQSSTLYSRVVLEFCDPVTGAVRWSQVVYDPSISGPTAFLSKPYILAAVTLLSSEDDSPTGKPWVIGRIDFSTIYQFGDIVSPINPQPTPPGLTRLSKVFTCDSQQKFAIRDADRNKDLDATGIWPWDLVSPPDNRNGDIRQPLPLLVNGVQYGAAPNPSGSDYSIYRYGG